mgnify:CR=1 FL=1
MKKVVSLFGAIILLANSLTSLAEDQPAPAQQPLTPEQQLQQLTPEQRDQIEERAAFALIDKFLQERISPWIKKYDGMIPTAFVIKPDLSIGVIGNRDPDPSKIANMEQHLQGIGARLKLGAAQKNYIATLLYYHVAVQKGDGSIGNAVNVNYDTNDGVSKVFTYVYKLEGEGEERRMVVTNRVANEGAYQLFPKPNTN